MAQNDAGQGVDVNVGSCRCPGGSPTRHPDGDTVTLRPEVSIAMGVAAQQAMHDTVTDPGAVGASVASMAGAFANVYLGFGIIGWSFLDAIGQPVPITPEATARLLPWDNGGMEVAEEADRLYGATLLAPFLRRLAASSSSGQTESSTSPTPVSGGKRPTPLRRSSHPNRAGKRSGVKAR